jgi:hypothetical protein
VKRIITSISKAYRDPQGFEYESIKGLLLSYFFRHQKVHVAIPDKTISVEGETARAEVQAVLTGDQSDSAMTILPESLGVYTFEVSLRKEENEWMVTSARWHRAGEGKNEQVK